jgi:hypothetical protein
MSESAYTQLGLEAVGYKQMLGFDEFNTIDCHEMSCLTRMRKASSAITYLIPQRYNSTDLGKFNDIGYLTPSLKQFLPST